jgi:crotonobetainyl-CoA:carnitine CoA-transferase CaiB-like acyl-CoA transferase
MRGTTRDLRPCGAVRLRGRAKFDATNNETRPGGPSRAIFWGETMTGNTSAVTDSTKPTGPLAGIRVLDLTSVVLGPYATQTLGDMGADVIKIESHDGDILRHVAPSKTPKMGAVFLNANRNKRSLAIDLKSPEGRDAVLKLAANADVFVQSMRPQAIKRLGLDYAAVSAVKPDIIYCSTWGFNSEGPYGVLPAYDDVIQGMSGLADLARRRSGGDPEFAPSVIADKVTGLTAYGAITTALFHHARTGEGQNIEVPMFETIAAFNLVEHLAGHAYEEPVGTMGYNRALVPERRPFRTADGYIAVLPYSDRHWRGFFKAVGQEHLAEDPRFTTANARSQNVSLLYSTIADAMPTRTTMEWLEAFGAVDVPAVPINRLEDLKHDPHLQDVGFWQGYPHPSEGPLRTTAVPVKYAQTPGQPCRLPAPRLGEHTRAILAEAGLSDTEVGDLLDRGIALQAEQLEG